MKSHNILLASALLCALMSNVARAEDAAAAPAAKPDNEVAFNLGVTTDYRYRGISQTNLDPAIQGGADYTNNPTGFYAGTWLSTIKWTKDVSGTGDVEWDLYAGKRGDIMADTSYDVGVLSYVYPSNGMSSIPGFVSANTTEFYGQLTYKLLNVKYSQSVTDLFGTPDSKNSMYVDVFSNIDLADGYSLALHAGHQKASNNSIASYTDWKIGVSKDMFGVNWALAAIGTNANKSFYVTPSGSFTGKTALVLTVLKTF
jgi:uncharacterized protein (TIGR02001 family)